VTGDRKRSEFPADTSFFNNEIRGRHFSVMMAAGTSLGRSIEGSLITHPTAASDTDFTESLPRGTCTAEEHEGSFSRKLHDEAQPFQSVIYGYSLADVMDTIVRGRVQSVLASEFGSRTLDNGIAQKADIMKKVSEIVTNEFKTKGITITFVGYAESLNFDKEVQEAINATFIATRQAQKAIALAPALTTLQAQTNMETQKILASKWNGGLPALPSWVLFTGDAWNSVINWFKK
jgi:hypothetical protein